MSPATVMPRVLRSWIGFSGTERVHGQILVGRRDGSVSGTDLMLRGNALVLWDKDAKGRGFSRADSFKGLVLLDRF